jgi:hypothetical protein
VKPVYTLQPVAPSQEYLDVLMREAETGTFNTVMLVRRQEMVWILQRLKDAQENAAAIEELWGDGCCHCGKLRCPHDT